MRKKRSLLFTLVVVSAMALLLLAAGSASARTRGFTIYNLTSANMKLTGVETFSTNPGEPVFEQGSPKPQKGTTLEPGQSIHVEIENPFTTTARATLVYEGDGSTFRVQLDNFFKTRCFSSGAGRGCQIDGKGESQIELLDPAGSKVILKDGDLQHEKSILEGLCSEANHCEFEPTERDENAFSVSRIVGAAVANCNETAADTTIGVKTKEGISNSVGIDAETNVSVFGLFKSKVTIKYKFEISSEKEFSQDVKVPIEPDHIAWVDFSAPVIRDTGVWTLSAGNTSWTLEGVYFDSPDTKSGRGAKYVVDGEEMTEAVRGKECHGKKSSDGLVRVPVDNIVAKRIGTQGANLIAGGPEANLIHGRGGNDILSGGGGPDDIFGGSGGDVIEGGPGADILNGGGGGDKIIDLSGPTTVNTGTDKAGSVDMVDVADGKNDDTVSCLSSRSLVYADPGDRVSAKCGEVIREPPPPGTF